MWSGDASFIEPTWPEGLTTSQITHGVEDLRDGLNDSSAKDGQTALELSEWLVKLDLAATLLMNFNTVTLMLGMGAATYWKEFWEHMRRPWACLVGMTCQFVLLPAVGFGLCLAFHLLPYEALGVLILACCPGGAFSNFFTFWVDGDLALSIMMTALSSMLAFGVMPLNIWLYSWRWTNQELQVPYIKILISLVIVTLPVIAGMVIRHCSRKWANYISKVCSVLGWAGALTCGALLMLRYWTTIVRSSIYLVIIAALTPLTGFVVAYIIVKTLCFSHKICRTVAIETGCQNMVVATSIILLSFTDPEMWVFAHRHDVTEEDITSVVDTSVLTSIPVPAHKLSQAGMKQMVDYSTVPNVCNGPGPPRRYQETSGYWRFPDIGEWRGPEDNDAFLPRASEIEWDDRTPGTPPMTPNHFSSHDHDSTADYSHEDSTDLDPCSDSVLESARNYDSDGPCSPSLSNKGVPNMFPVTESDFQNNLVSDGEDSPLPYGSPLPFNRRQLDCTSVECNPASASPTSPGSPAEPYARPFAFYHRDVRLGQTQQFSTFGRKF